LPPPLTRDSSALDGGSSRIFSAAPAQAATKMYLGSIATGVRRRSASYRERWYRLSKQTMPLQRLKQRRGRRWPRRVVRDVRRGPKRAAGCHGRRCWTDRPIRGDDVPLSEVPPELIRARRLR